MSNIIQMEEYRRPVNHPLCGDCPKNGISCRENDNVCLPLEMFVQICKEPKSMKRLEYIDNVADMLDLK